MKRIAKKEFIELLSSKESAILYCIHPKEDYLDRIEEAVKDESADDNSNKELEFRSFKSKRANGIRFSNDSVIDFDKKSQEFYHINNCAVYHYKYVDDFDGTVYYYYIVYLLK